jgi:hypothetical protein
MYSVKSEVYMILPQVLLSGLARYPVTHAQTPPVIWALVGQEPLIPGIPETNVTKIFEKLF